MFRSLSNTQSILANSGAKKWPILFMYLKLFFQFTLLTKLLHIKHSSTTLFGKRFYFNDPRTFFFLFEEIFIAREYYFHTDKKDPVIIDCGSNIGLSLLFFNLYYPEAKIIAFEPEPTTFQYLQKNTAAFNTGSVQLYNAALYNMKGKLTFYTSNPDGSLLGASFHTSDYSGVKPIEVSTLLLSDFIQGPVDFIKLDIEGAESAVLGELSETKKLSLISEMSIEYHHHLNENEDTLSAFLSILEKNGFGYHFTDTFGNPGHSKKGIKQDIIIRAYRKNGSDNTLNS